MGRAGDSTTRSRDFAIANAVPNEQDHQALLKAIRSGKVTVMEE
jgi:hypothetical protein